MGSWAYQGRVSAIEGNIIPSIINPDYIQITTIHFFITEAKGKSQ